MKSSILLILCTILLVQSIDWSGVENVLETAIKNKAFPGCVALVGNQNGMMFFEAFGNFTFGSKPPHNMHNVAMEKDTIFDMASCTKVTTVTTALAQFYQRGQVGLNDKITKFLGDGFGSHGKEDITVLNCLLHNSGFPPDPIPNYWETTFNCSENSEFHPREVFDCQTTIYDALLSQTLQNPVGEKYVYSDLSMITLMHVTGHLAREFGYVQRNELRPECAAIDGPGITQCYYEKYIDRYVLKPANMIDSTYLPSPSIWHRCAPTRNATTYRHGVLQGQVDDGNTFAMGGISGHAGLFSTGRDIFHLAQKWLTGSDNFLNQTTIDLWKTEYNNSQSSRALGWNTNDPTAYDHGWGLSCGPKLSPKTYLHVGYTGTQICIDPENNIITILLTNRVFPDVSNTQIQQVRRDYGDAVAEALNFANPN